eukprot:1905733-Prymnesium_polylepis.1
MRHVEVRGGFGSARGSCTLRNLGGLILRWSAVLALCLPPGEPVSVACLVRLKACLLSYDLRGEAGWWSCRSRMCAVGCVWVPDLGLAFRARPV